MTTTPRTHCETARRTQSHSRRAPPNLNRKPKSSKRMPFKRVESLLGNIHVLGCGWWRLLLMLCSSTIIQKTPSRQNDMAPNICGCDKCECAATTLYSLQTQDMLTNIGPGVDSIHITDGIYTTCVLRCSASGMAYTSFYLASRGDSSSSSSLTLSITLKGYRAEWVCVCFLGPEWREECCHWIGRLALHWDQWHNSPRGSIESTSDKGSFLH